MFNLVLVFKEEVDVVERIHQAILLVAVDFESLAPTRSKVGDGLVWHIHLHLHLRILLDALEEFCQEFITYHYWQHEVVQLVVLVDVGKERGDDHAEAIARNCPSRMFTTRTRTEVLACHQNLMHSLVWSFTEICLVKDEG